MVNNLDVIISCMYTSIMYNYDRNILSCRSWTSHKWCCCVENLWRALATNQDETAESMRSSHSLLPTAGPLIKMWRKVLSKSFCILLWSLVLRSFQAPAPLSGHAFDTGREKTTFATGLNNVCACARCHRNKIKFRRKCDVWFFRVQLNNDKKAAEYFPLLWHLKCKYLLFMLWKRTI